MNEKGNINVTICVNGGSVNIFYANDGWLKITVGTEWKD